MCFKWVMASRLANSLALTGTDTMDALLTYLSGGDQGQQYYSNSSNYNLVVTSL